MKNMKFWRTALVATLVLTVMLSVTGGTIAWFTDTVTSEGNKIQAGNLDVELLMYKDNAYEAISDSTAPIFGTGAIATNSTNTLWEPGKTQIVYLGVQNKGNLDIKYNIELNVVDGGLIGALEYAVVAGAKSGDLNVNDWAALKASAIAETGDVAVGITKAAPYGAIKAGDNAIDYFALAVHMKEEAGNEYQNKDMTLDITVLATQLASEEDSFGSDYDASANVYNVSTTAEAQAALDEAENGTVINLAAGEYDMLYFRQSEASDVVEGYDYAQSTYDEVKIRTIKNLTINGNDAKVKGFATEAGTYYNDNVWQSNSEKYPILESFIVLENVKIDNVAFTGEATAIGISGKTSVDGLTVTNCTMHPATNTTPKYAFVSAVPNGAKPAYDNVNGETFKVQFANVTIDNCQASYIDRLVLAHISENLTVTNCKLSNADNHFINLQGPAEWTPAHTGTITITDNDFTNGHDRFFRAAKVGNAHIVMERNDVFSAFYNNSEPDEELVKVDVVSGTEVTYTNVDNGFGTYKVVVE